MAIDGEKTPFWQIAMTSSDDSGSTSASPFVFRGGNNPTGDPEEVAGSFHDGKSGARVMAAVAKFLLPARRRLRLDPPNKLYFPCKQQSLEIKSGAPSRSRTCANLLCASRSDFKNFHNSAQNPVCSNSSLDWTTNNLTPIEFFVSIQFQTTAPKNFYMRPPGGELVPGESIIATGKSPKTISSFPKLLLASSRLLTIRNLIVGSVFKFVEPLECGEHASKAAREDLAT